MKRWICRIVCGLIVYGAWLPLPCEAAKEFLTQLEIEKIQEAQEVDKRIKIYLEAASLRLKTAEDRLSGKESQPGDPLEFFSVEEMIDGYNRIVKSVMANIDEAVQRPKTDPAKFGKALKELRDATDKTGKDLEILKKIAEEKKQENLWNLLNQGIDITGGAHEGAELGLSRHPPPKTKK